MIEGNLEWAQARIEYLKKNDPDAAMDLFLDLLEYFKPKLARTEVKAEVDQKVSYSINFKR